MFLSSPKMYFPTSEGPQWIVCLYKFKCTLKVRIWAHFLSSISSSLIIGFNETVQQPSDAFPNIHYYQDQMRCLPFCNSHTRDRGWKTYHNIHGASPQSGFKTGSRMDKITSHAILEAYFLKLLLESANRVVIVTSRISHENVHQGWTWSRVSSEIRLGFESLSESSSAANLSFSLDMVPYIMHFRWTTLHPQAFKINFPCRDDGIYRQERKLTAFFVVEFEIQRSHWHSKTFSCG